MTSTVDRVANGLNKLKSLSETPATIGERDKIVKQLKSDLCFFDSIPPCYEADAKQCILAREVYEYATLLSVEKKDIQEYEQHMSVLKTYYDEEFRSLIPDSQKMYTLIGLHLLYLLAYNKISEYHTEIELLPASELHSNVFIRVPVSLEQHFVEGSYNKILGQRQAVPHEAYQVFVDKFVDAIRFEIARSAERAYESLKLVDTGKLFMIPNEAELRQFIANNNGKEGVEWRVDGDRVWFNKQRADQKEIPSQKMIGLCLEYATELNRIV